MRHMRLSNEALSDDPDSAFTDDQLSDKEEVIPKETDSDVEQPIDEPALVAPTDLLKIRKTVNSKNRTIDLSSKVSIYY